MPGAEHGDKIHNFFGSDNITPSPHLSGVVNGAWTGLENNVGHGVHSQGASSFLPNTQNSRLGSKATAFENNGSSHGLKFFQSTSGSDILRRQRHVHQLPSNGYVQGHWMFKSNQNDSGGVAFNSEINGHDLSLHGVYGPQRGQFSDIYTKKSGLTEISETSIDYDFLAGHHQVVNQNAVIPPIDSRQQPVVYDMELLQQKFWINGVQEAQRQQQVLKQQEPSQILVKDFVGNHPASLSHLINGVPVQDLSSGLPNPALIPSSTSWLHHNASLPNQGPQSRHAFGHEQAEAMSAMGRNPSQIGNSMYRDCVSGNRDLLNHSSMLHMEKPKSPHIAGATNSFLSSQDSGSSEQANVHSEYSSRYERGKSSGVIPGTQTLSGGMNLQYLDAANSMQRNQVLQDLNSRLDTAQQQQVAQNNDESHNIATLDPAEARILFGTDDNLMDAFRDSGITAGGFNVLGGSDISRTFSSVNCGSWSALMQSAVAESSDNMVFREEWSGLVPPASSSKDLQSHSFCSGDKQQLNWLNNDLKMSTLNSGSFNLPYTKDNDMDPVQAVGVAPYKQMDLPKRLPNEDKSNWEKAESCQEFNKVLRSSAETNDMKQKYPIRGDNNHFCNSINASNFTYSAQPNRLGVLVSEKGGYQPLKQEGHRFNHLESELQNSKYTLECDKIDEKSPFKGTSSLSDSIYGQNGLLKSREKDTIEILQCGNSDFSAKSNRSHGNWEERMTKSGPIVELSRTNCLSNGTVDKHDSENSHSKEKESSIGSREHDSSDTRGVKKKSSSAHKVSTGRKFHYHPMGDVEMDSNQSCNTLGASRFKSMIGRASQQLKNNGLVNTSQSQNYNHIVGGSQQLINNGLVNTSQSQNYDHIVRGSMDVGKANCSEHTNTNRTSGSSVPSSSGQSAPQILEPKSSNRLQLFNKYQVRDMVDNARGCSNFVTLPSEMPESDVSDINCDQHVKTTSSHRGFGLQLGLSSPKSSSLGHFSQNSAGISNDLSGTHGTAVRDETDRKLLVSVSSTLSLGCSRESGNDKQGSMSTSLPTVFPSAKAHVQDQLVINTRQQVSSSQSVFGVPTYELNQLGNKLNQSLLASESEISHSAPLNGLKITCRSNQSADSVTKHSELPAAFFGESNQNSALLQEYVSPNESCQMRSRSNQFSYNRPLSNQSCKLSPEYCTQDKKTALASKPVDREDERTRKGTQYVPSNSDIPFNSVSVDRPDCWHRVSQESDSTLRSAAAPRMDLPPASLRGVSFVTARSSRGVPEVLDQPSKFFSSDIQCSSSSKRTEEFSYSENDFCDRAEKKLKVGDDSVKERDFCDKAPSFVFQGDLEVHDKVGMDVSVREKVVHSEDHVMLSTGETTNSHTAAVSSNHLVRFGRDDSQNLSVHEKEPTRYARHGHQVSSWFDIYGTPKNEQTISTLDRQNSAIKTNDILLSGDSNIVCNENTFERGSHSTSDEAVPVSIDPKNPSCLAIYAKDDIEYSASKKRKTATSDLIGWLAEAICKSKFQSISDADRSWAKAVNFLTEKVEDDFDIIEDIPAAFRYKRRVTLTTKLMQMLLSAPTLPIFLGNAIASYDSLTYVVSRSCMDATCDMISWSDDSSKVTSIPMECDQDNRKTRRQHFLKVVEDFICRSQKLEDDLLRMNRIISLLDLRAECHDLEKISVINRFAKFHGRNQAEIAGSHSSWNAFSNVQRHLPVQRYVTALPMPPHLPEGVQCLAL